MTDAPYTDPDGYPSHQPSPAVRQLDALVRRARLAGDVSRAHERLLEAEQEVLEARQALADAIETLNLQTRLAITYASQRVVDSIDANGTFLST
jgi:hypothetical protein